MKPINTILVLLLTVTVAGCGSGPFYRDNSYQARQHATGSAANNERYRWFSANTFKITEQSPVSAVALDVDTASYAITRRYLRDGKMPPPYSVRTEELINYFPYDYPKPRSLDERVRLTGTVLDTPWNPDTKLLHIALKAYDLKPDERPKLNVVFLVDTSGSQEDENELPLMKRILSEAVYRFQPEDQISIVSYASSVEVNLRHTVARDIKSIQSAIDDLYPGGSSAGGPALREAYNQAESAFDRKAVNRIILISDGDFNVWDDEASSQWQLQNLIRQKRKKGIYLSVIGIGTGDLDDEMMQSLAQLGNGTAAYVESLEEATKVLVTEFQANFYPIADDARFMVEFNPARVAEYRLIGYETRLQSASEFTDPNNNAGEIGSGQSVTMLYEITPPDSPARRLLPLRYGTEPEDAVTDHGNEYALIRLRYKNPGEIRNQRVEMIVDDSRYRANRNDISDDVMFATSLAAFAGKLRRDEYIGKEFSYYNVKSLAMNSIGDDSSRLRAGFLELVDRAEKAEDLAKNRE